MGSEARARLGLAALLAVTLLGFSRVFKEGDYPGPALLGMMFAVGIALLARRIGLNSLVTLLVSIGALIWYLCVIFAASKTFYGLPTPGAVRELYTQVDRVYELSNIDYAPVPLRSGYVMLMISAMWTLAVLGEIATFRWRRPLLVAIAAAAMFSFTLIVGISEGAPFFSVLFLLGLLTYLGLESAHRLRSWGRWVSVWSQRHWDTEITTGPLARKMAASCVAAAVIAPLFLPSIGGGILSWRNPTGPGGTGGQIDTLVSLAPKLVRQTDEVLFTVDSTSPAYWRLITLTLFDGNTWHPEPNRQTLTNGRVATDVPPPQPGVEVDQTIEIDGLEGDLLPAVTLPETVGFQGEDADDYNDSLQFNPVTGDLQTSRPLVEGLRYSTTSLVPNISFQSMADSTVPSVQDLQESAFLPAFLPQNVYEVPTDFCPPASGGDACPLQNSRIYKIAHRWTKDADTPFEKLLLLQDRFRGQYTHRLPGRQEVNQVEVKPLASADYLTEFLTETKTGYCQQFATAFAVLARMLGYPARVSVGFLPGETSIERPNHYIVRGNDAHAWPEVYFNEVGWVAFEPTPRAAAPPPAYTQSAPSASGVNPPALDPGAGRASQGNQNPRGLRDTLNVRPGRGRARRAQPQEPDLWHDSFLRLAGLLGLIMLIVLILTPLSKVYLARRRYRHARGGSEFAGAAFAEFEQEAADLAAARAPSESASNYVKRLIALQKIPTRPALRLVDIFEEAAYGRIPVPDLRAKEAVRLTRQLRRELWADATWLERAGRLFSPTVVLAELRRLPANGRPGDGHGFLRAGRVRGRTPHAAERR